MTYIARAFCRALSVATLVAMLAGCGGGSDSAADASTGGGSSGGAGGSGGGSSGGGGDTAAIEGVATPSSVSVVTATNAN